MKNQKLKGILKKEILSSEISRKITLYLLAFLIPFIILIFIFIILKIFPFGNYVYLPSDSFAQYANYLGYLRNSFFGGDNLFYSLSKSLGGEMYGLFTYYLASPFNLLALFFDKSIITIGFDLILCLKISCTGIAFCYFLNRRKKANFANLIFSCMYALCSYVITYGFNIMWLDSVILLPVVIAGLEDLITLKKPYIYCLALSLTLITNYYMGFFVCIFSGIFFIYELILNKPNSKKEILKTILRFIIFSLISALIAGVILIPSYLSIREGRADFDISDINFEKNFEIQNVISKFFTDAFNAEECKNDSMPPLFCGVLANFLVILFFTNKKIPLKEKILNIILILIFLISFYIKKINMLWMLGNTPAWYIYRYAFCFNFIYILIAYRSFENIEGTSLLKIFLSFIIYILFGICVLKFNLGDFNKFWVKIDLILIAIIAIVLSIYKITLNRKKIKFMNFIIILIFIINISNLIVNSYFSTKEIADELSPITETLYAGYMSKIENRINKIKSIDSSIYRIEQENKMTANDPLILNFNSTNFTGSTYSKNLYDFLESLGYCRKHVAIQNKYGNTKTMDMLFGIKYNYRLPEYTNLKELVPVVEENNFTIYKNPYALNLGFCVSANVLNEFKKKANIFETQNLLMQNITRNV